MSPTDFAEYLLSRALITPESAKRLIAAYQGTAQPIDIIIRELGILPEKIVVSELASYVGIALSTNVTTIESSELLDTLGIEYASTKAMIPYGMPPDDIGLVIADPFDLEAIRDVRYFFEKELRLQLAPRSSIESWFRTTIGSQNDENPPPRTNEDDAERLLDIAKEAPVVRFVQRIMQQAVDTLATDIHIEPQPEFVRVRLRQDGALVFSEEAPLTLHAGIISRLKILARLNIAERRLPQDGRLRIPIRGQEVDFRLSVMPSVHGETAVLRVLDRENVKLDLEVLGFDETAAADLRKLARKPNGILLVTGPTGSGKTTTLYSLLLELNDPRVKIFTIEDPVEYRIAGITQLQVDVPIGLTFATALRSVLRQDPDIILVGEIRDRETAEIAVRAALTGHLVLSTLHTNSAAAAFGRLRDMGIEPFLIEATVRGVVSQRLLRQTCIECHGADADKSCRNCGGTGYKGRRATYEILQVDERIKRAMLDGASETELQSLAVASGMCRIATHALQLAKQGKTTLSEVSRVAETPD